MSGFLLNSRSPMRHVALAEMFNLTSIVKIAELLPLSGHIGQSIPRGEVDEKRPKRALPPH